MSFLIRTSFWEHISAFHPPLASILLLGPSSQSSEAYYLWEHRIIWSSQTPALMNTHTPFQSMETLQSWKPSFLVLDSRLNILLEDIRVILRLASQKPLQNPPFRSSIFPYMLEKRGGKNPSGELHDAKRQAHFEFTLSLFVTCLVYKCYSCRYLRSTCYREETNRTSTKCYE